MVGFVFANPAFWILETYVFKFQNIEKHGVTRWFIITGKVVSPYQGCKGVKGHRKWKTFHRSSKLVGLIAAELSSAMARAKTVCPNYLPRPCVACLLPFRTDVYWLKWWSLNKAKLKCKRNERKTTDMKQGYIVWLISDFSDCEAFEDFLQRIFAVCSGYWHIIFDFVLRPRWDETIYCKSIPRYSLFIPRHL
jgi:hypothetical protein